MVRVSETILQRCVAKGGVMKGTRVMTFVALWSIAEREEGRELTIEEYLRWSREPRRTVYRRQAEFREVFPEFRTPHPLALVVADQVAALRDRRGRVPESRLLPALSTVSVP